MSDAMTFNEAVIDLKQYIARCAGGHQVYIQAKIDALVAAHEREVYCLEEALICNGGNCARRRFGLKLCKGCKFVKESEAADA